MNRKQIKRHNKKVIRLVAQWLKSRHTNHWDYVRMRLLPPRMGYKELAANLNKLHLLSSRGNYWTMRSLYRMMQRQNVALHTIQRRVNNGHLQTF